MYRKRKHLTQNTGVVWVPGVLHWLGTGEVSQSRIWAESGLEL